MLLKEKEQNKGKNKKVKKKSGVWKKILLLFLLIIVAAGGVFAYKTYKNGGGVGGIIATVIGHDENTKKNLSEFRVLILGVSTDLGEEALLTDTIIVASYNPNTQKATLLSIPRDTFTGKNSAKATPSEKINALYSYTKSPNATLKFVNEITGLNIEHYAVIRTEALIELVDAIGGVEFNVPIDMKYDDPSQDLHIDLKAGQQRLNSDQAEQLVRFRHNNNGTSYPEEYGDNDTGRMRTQRDFIMQVLKQTLKPENIFKIGQIIEIANKCVDTNVDIEYAKDYVPYAVEFSTEDIVTGVLPGTNSNNNTSGTWIFIYNKTETAKLVQELFYDRDISGKENNEIAENINTENNTNDTTVANTSVPNTINNAAISSNKSEIKLEVLNACANTKLFEKAVKELKNAGYNVVRTGDTNLTSKTTIIDKKEVNDIYLRNIKEMLGTGAINSSELNSSSKVDITIVLGKDFK